MTKRHNPFTRGKAKALIAAAPQRVECKGCTMGGYECQIPMPIRGRVRHIDRCIADIVAALNAANLVTVASCGGHGVADRVITLEDGRKITITEDDSQ